ncbi:MAG: T9SS type A sorting domain-containing protein [Bacteroidota bacterium]
MTCFLLLAWLPLVTWAQPYSCFPEQEENYYQETFGQRVFGWRADSVTAAGSDVWVHNYRQLESDQVFFPDTCIGLSSWTGVEAIRQASGRWVFLNKQGDSIFVETTALPQQTWHLYRYGDGGYIEAEVLSHGLDTVLGQLDSIKVIELNRKDANGNLMAAPDINGRQLHLSRTYGLVQLPMFYRFPDLAQFFHLVGTSLNSLGLNRWTRGEVYDFEVGDEFHYRIDDSWGSAQLVNEDRGFRVTRVLDKMPDVANNSVTYVLERGTRIQEIRPPDVTLVTTKDTVSVTLGQLDEFLIPEFMPWEFVMDPNEQYFNQYHYRGSTSLCDQIAFVLEDDSPLGYWNDNGCIRYEIPLDGGSEASAFMPGLGRTLELSAGKDGTNGFFYSTSLAYYNTSQGTCGTPLTQYPVTVPEPPQAPATVQAFPNPTTGTLQLRTDSDIRAGTFRLADMLGKAVEGRVGLMQSGARSLELDLASLPSGIYFLRLQTERGAVTHKVVRQ